MKIIDIIKYSRMSLANRKLRSFFTILGVVVGITAIISLLALGDGLEQAIDGQFEKGFSTDTITIAKQTSIMSRTDFEIHLFNNDTTLVETIDHVESAVAVMQKQVYITINETDFLTVVYGIDFEKYSQLFPDTFTLKNGTLLEKMNDSIILGNDFFLPWGNNTSIIQIGQNLTMNWLERTPTSTDIVSTSLQVSGVLDYIGAYSSFGAPSDNALYMDISYTENIFATDECSMIIVQLSDDSQETIDSVSQSIKEIFGENVGVITLSAMRETINTAMSIITYFLAAIGAISLFVAGIGIMNIMTISVLERTREIGILKALGTKEREIFGMFIFESLWIGLLGVILGTILGFIFSFGAANFINQRDSAYIQLGGKENNSSPLDVQFLPIFSLLMILKTILFGLGVSILFGVIPAYRAARLNPIDAIRYE